MHSFSGANELKTLSHLLKSLHVFGPSSAGTMLLHSIAIYGQSRYTRTQERERAPCFFFFSYHPSFPFFAHFPHLLLTSLVQVANVGWTGPSARFFLWWPHRPILRNALNPHISVSHCKRHLWAPSFLFLYSYVNVRKSKNKKDKMIKASEDRVTASSNGRWL